MINIKLSVGINIMYEGSEMNYDNDESIFFPLLSRTNVDCTSGTYGPYDSLYNSTLNNGSRVLPHHEPNYYITAAPSSPDLPRGDNGRVSRLLALT